MFQGKKIVVAAAFLLLLAPGRAALADDKERVLRQLDAAAAKFHNTAAEFQFHSIQTDPVFDEEVQEGTIYYERAGGAFQMAGHIAKVNGKAVPKVYTFSKGVFQLYEKLINQITVFKAGNKAESYVILGFGASGKDLEDKWEIKYLGPESLPDGKTMVKTEKLELVAKDPAVRKNIARVLVWVDTERAISLKQIFYENASERRECFYFNIKVNAPLPADAFTFKTDGKPQIVTR
jgi:outer membrane lipoprotein-sorting protein